MRVCCTAIWLLLVLAGCSKGPAEFDAPPPGPFSSSGEWPQWLGPERTGVSKDKGLLREWPAGGPKLLWKATNLGSGFSSIAVSQGRIYTMGKRDDAAWVLALDASSGEELWAQRVGGKYSNSKGGGPRATPTVVQDRVYALSANGDLSCLSTDDGEVQWQINVLERFGGENIKWGISESPLVDGDRVFVTTGSPNGSIVALNRNDGELVWQSKQLTDRPGYASALVESVGGVRQLIHVTDAAAVGVRVDDGRLLWRYKRAANDTANCTTPVYDAGHVFVTSGYDTGAALLKLTSNGAGTDAEEVYFTRNMKNHHGGVVLVDGHVYGFSDKNLTCIDFKTGERKWRDKSVGKGSLTAADGMLYVLSERGGVGLVRATPEGYQEASRFQIGRKSSKSWAYPVVIGGRLYIRNRDDLLCFDVKA